MSQTAGTKTRKMTWKDGGTQKTQRPRKERLVEPETEKYGPAGPASVKKTRENRGQQRPRYSEGTGKGFPVREGLGETKNMTQSAEQRTERTNDT